ncbi:vegetative cell wall protein gp1-like [Iris pallida]|uniref:Vegetative cell wall protein gp1-like n=1 Tax=Iris pallida TaxID=29817 RepID=A0AAX6FUE2_IRIPA|nr:vegetative cell wall protein gp1-like [Iris pallida]
MSESDENTELGEIRCQTSGHNKSHKRKTLTLTSSLSWTPEPCCTVGRDLPGASRHLRPEPSSPPPSDPASHGTAYQIPSGRPSRPPPPGPPNSSTSWSATTADRHQCLCQAPPETTVPARLPAVKIGGQSDQRPATAKTDPAETNRAAVPVLPR